MTAFRPVHPLPAARVFCGRGAELGALTGFLARGGIAGIEGMGGAGKTALLAQLVRGLEQPDGMAWSFYVQADADAMFGALYRVLTGEELAAGGASRVDATLRALKDRKGFLLILDGFERMQSVDAPHDVEDASLRHFLERFPKLETGAACICASRFPLPLASEHIPVGGLAAADAMALLRARGLPGGDAALREVVRRYAGHPLTLILVAGAVGRFLEGDPARHAELRPAGAGAAPGMGAAEEALTRVLGFYRDRLSPQAAALLARMSLFRGPADERTLEAVFLRGDPAVGGELAGLEAPQLRALLEELDALGLVEHIDDRLWVAHAVVRDFFPPDLADAGRVHIAVARFLGMRPGPPRQKATLSHLALLEEAVHHALKAGSFDFALHVYWKAMGASDVIREAGDFARGERLVRALLDGLGRVPDAPVAKREADDEEEEWQWFASRGSNALQAMWRPRLHNELAIYLDQQGRIDEAARYYWRAFWARVHQKRWKEVCLLFMNLADNAVLRGRLPLAERLARSALHRAAEEHLPEDEAQTYLDYVRHLRRGTCDTHHGVSRTEKSGPRGRVSGTGVLLETDIVLWLGAAAEAHVLARQNCEQTKDHALTTAHFALLQQIEASFTLRSKDIGNVPSEVAARILAEPDLRRVVDRARFCGHRPLLARALTFRAMLHRRCGDTSGALNDLEEADDICRRHGLLRHLVHNLLESRHLFGAEPVREALAIAKRPEIDYGWGALEAATWLDLYDRGARGASLEIQLDTHMDEAREGCRHGKPLEITLAKPVDEPDLRGEDPLASTVAVPGPARAVVRVPVETWLSDSLASLLEEANPDALRSRYSEVWSAYYRSQLQNKDLPGPIYHLAVMLVLEGRVAHAAAVADDLRACRPPFAGAGCLRAACASTISSAIDFLREALAEEREAPATVTCATAFDLGQLLERQGRIDEARRAYQRALSADWRCAAARRSLRRLDEERESREKCRRMLQQSLRAAEAWRGEVGRFPATLDELGRGLMRSVPRCPERGDAYRYRVGSSGGRCLLACPIHRLRLDSTRGDLTPFLPPDPMAPKLENFFRRMRAVGEDFQRGRLLVTAHRTRRVVE